MLSSLCFSWNFSGSEKLRNFVLSSLCFSWNFSGSKKLPNFVVDPCVSRKISVIFKNCHTLWFKLISKLEIYIFFVIWAFSSEKINVVWCWVPSSIFRHWLYWKIKSRKTSHVFGLLIRLCNLNPFSLCPGHPIRMNRWILVCAKPRPLLFQVITPDFWGGGERAEVTSRSWYEPFTLNWSISQGYFYIPFLVLLDVFSHRLLRFPVQYWTGVLQFQRRRSSWRGDAATRSADGADASQRRSPAKFPRAKFDAVVFAH